MGLYGGDGINAEYAKKGLEYLKNNKGVDVTPIELWLIVNKGKAKAYKQQMDVVIALYKAGLR